MSMSRLLGPGKPDQMLRGKRGDTNATENRDKLWLHGRLGSNVDLFFYLISLSCSFSAACSKIEENQRRG